MRSRPGSGRTRASATSRSSPRCSAAMPQPSARSASSGSRWPSRRSSRGWHRRTSPRWPATSMARATHRTLHRPARTIVYQPMLELIEELRRRAVTISIVTGGGTEFVRAISDDLYGVPPEAVVGTLIKYQLLRDADGRPTLSRTARIDGDANEGATKVTNIQTQLGRRPVLAGGNSGGDREMLEWACTGDGAGLALLIDHDDTEREFRYVSTAQ